MATKDNKQIPEPRKDEFLSYLKKTGISEKLTKIILSLYEETSKPENVDEFLQRNFQKPDDLDTVYLKNEVLRLREELNYKNKEIAELKQTVEKLKENANEED